jgi:hypothetical protein
MDNSENTVQLLCSADHTQNTSHMIAKHCWGVMSLHLRESVFTKPLLRNGCFCGSAILAWSIYTTVQSDHTCIVHIQKPDWWFMLCFVQSQLFSMLLDYR